MARLHSSPRNMWTLGLSFPTSGFDAGAASPIPRGCDRVGFSKLPGRRYEGKPIIMLLVGLGVAGSLEVARHVAGWLTCGLTLIVAMSDFLSMSLMLASYTSPFCIWTFSKDAREQHYLRARHQLDSYHFDPGGVGTFRCC